MSTGYISESWSLTKKNPSGTQFSVNTFFETGKKTYFRRKNC